VLTDAPLPAGRPLSGDCGPCRRCIDACPIEALRCVPYRDTTHYLGYSVVTPSGGRPRAFFVYPWKDPTTFQMLDLNTGQITTFPSGGDFFNSPGCFTWSPRSEEAFIFVMAGRIDWVDVLSGQMRVLVPKGAPPLTWAEEGIVTQWSDEVELWGEDGQMKGQILFAP